MPRKQYVTEDGFTTNGVESFWALFKRQYHGTHHYAHRSIWIAYVSEMALSVRTARN